MPVPARRGAGLPSASASGCGRRPGLAHTIVIRVTASGTGNFNLKAIGAANGSASLKL